MVKPSPQKAIIVSIMVQDLRVCLTSIPKYLLTSQKPLSFTCDRMVAPDAMDMTISASSGALGLIKLRTGAIIPAAVIMATVADPWVTLTMAARTQARRMGGIAESEMDWAIISPIPLSTRICFSTPPAPVIRMMIPAGPSALLLKSRSSCFDFPLLIPRK